MSVGKEGRKGEEGRVESLVQGPSRIGLPYIKRVGGRVSKTTFYHPNTLLGMTK